MQAQQTEELAIVRCDPAREQPAFELAALAWPTAERTAYRKAIQDLIQGGQTDRVALVAAMNREHLVAAQLAQMLPGRAAVVWPPQFANGDEPTRERTAAAIGRNLAAVLKQGGMQIAQSLPAPGDNASEKWLKIGGFSRAADLLYLTVDTSLSPLAAPPLPFELQIFTPGALTRLIDVIQRTYIGTLDCPQIDGLRETADVIAGYQSVGDYRPELWSFVREEGRDVGCLLMNVHPDVMHAEIIYLALVPEVRGRGWGLELAKQALWLARETRSQRTVLAVDAANEPAVRLYSVAGFEVFDRRAVWLRTFQD